MISENYRAADESFSIRVTRVRPNPDSLWSYTTLIMDCRPHHEAFYSLWHGEKGTSVELKTAPTACFLVQSGRDLELLAEQRLPNGQNTCRNDVLHALRYAREKPVVRGACPHQPHEQVHHD